LGNPIDLRAAKALPRKGGRRPHMGKRRPREGGGFFKFTFKVLNKNIQRHHQIIIKKTIPKTFAGR
jgi:hypothetical protein